MRQHLGFLRISSTMVKIVAWLLLIFGVIGGIAILAGIEVNVPGSGAMQYPRVYGWIILIAYVFIFFFLSLIAKIADLLIRIIKDIEK